MNRTSFIAAALISNTEAQAAWPHTSKGDWMKPLATSSTSSRETKSPCITKYDDGLHNFVVPRFIMDKKCRFHVTVPALRAASALSSNGGETCNHLRLRQIPRRRQG